MGNLTAFDLQLDGETETLVDLRDVELQIDGVALAVDATDRSVSTLHVEDSIVEAARGWLDVGSDRSAHVALQLTRVQGTAGDADGLRLSTRDDSVAEVNMKDVQIDLGRTLLVADLTGHARVRFDLTNGIVHAADQLVAVTNTGWSSHFGSYLDGGELIAERSSQRPAIDILATNQSITRLAMGGSALWAPDTQASTLRILGGGASSTAVTLLDNLMTGPTVEFATLDASSSFCADVMGNRLGSGGFELSQEAGSSFSIAGFPGDGSDRLAVERHLRSTNDQTYAQVTGPSQSVQFSSASGCPLP